MIPTSTLVQTWERTRTSYPVPKTQKILATRIWRRYRTSSKGFNWIFSSRMTICVHIKLYFQESSMMFFSDEREVGQERERGVNRSMYFFSSLFIGHSCIVSKTILKIKTTLNLITFHVINLQVYKAQTLKLFWKMENCKLCEPNCLHSCLTFSLFKVGHTSNFLYQGLTAKYFLGINLHSKA